MKKLLSAFLLSCFAICSAQNKTAEKFAKANFLLQTDNTKEAYDMLKELKTEVKQTDTLYNYVIWYHTMAASEIEEALRMDQKYAEALPYAKEVLENIQKNKGALNEDFDNREAWMLKSITVDYFGSGDLNSFKDSKKELYERYKNKTLPEGINEYFNYDYFKLGDKNIWGYEWFKELPEDRFSGSFTKIVYYVYSTNSDGTDKDQLCRFHVLMFHGNEKFDYILERQQEIDGYKVSGSYYSYTYNKDIDYKKLKEDIISIVTNNTNPDTKRTIKLN